MTPSTLLYTPVSVTSALAIPALALLTTVSEREKVMSGNSTQVSNGNGGVPTAIAAQGTDNIPAPVTYEKEVKFFFKKAKKDALGEDLPRRPSVSLKIPVPTWDTIYAGFKEPVKQKYLLSLLEDAVVEAAREQVNDDIRPVNKQGELDISKLTLDFLANQPPSERRGSKIADEIWQGFTKDYMTIMPAILNRKEEQVATQAALFQKKLLPVKTNKDVLGILRKYIDMWLSNTQSGEDYQEVYMFLNERLDAYLGAEEIDWQSNI